MRLLSLTLALCAGCGLGLLDDASGGNSNLPTLGAGPYAKPDIDFDTPAEEPYVLSTDAQLRDPAVLRRDDGGFRIWLAREPDNQPEQSEIWYAELSSIHEVADRPLAPVMVPDQAWEETRVGAPAVIDAGDRLVMYYEGGVTERGVGRAESTDGGLTWTRSTGNPVLPGATEPTAARLPDGSWVLLVTRVDQPGIFRADSADGIGFTLADRPAVGARPDQATAFDRYGVSDPFLIVRETLGGVHWGLFFNGLGRAGEISVGFAASFDGLDWERFGGPDPVLHPGAPYENGPAAVLEPARGYLFFDERSQSRQKITVAVHP